ncbi:MAG: hypothetical protein A4E19_00240 [Nitrospira sp. SG-bin1]|nr:MAG: hypothetical protein A4E19_00240 [Nitrospira sp. SG-bin1]
MTEMMMKLAGVLMLTFVLFVSTAWPAEPVTINSLFTYPEVYRMKVVQVEGTVRNYHMNHFIGHNTKLEKCIQHFMVDDGTGTIQASYATLCGSGVNPVMLQDGDRITIEGHYLGTLDVRSVRKH